MKINIIGAGEAFNSKMTNSSYYLECSKNILIDCGFTVPFTFWNNHDANKIDIIYISHFHADHFFGLPALITRMIEENRTKDLLIIGQKNIDQMFNTTMNIAYANILTKANFKIIFQKFYDFNKIDNLNFYFARTNHSIVNYAICIKNEKNCIAFSGDGAPTNELINMYKVKKPELIIQECFSKNRNSQTHCSLEDIQEFNIEYKPLIALTHISRNEIDKFKNCKYKVLKDGEIINL